MKKEMTDDDSRQDPGHHPASHIDSGEESQIVSALKYIG